MTKQKALSTETKSSLNNVKEQKPRDEKLVNSTKKILAKQKTNATQKTKAQEAKSNKKQNTAKATNQSKQLSSLVFPHVKVNTKLTKAEQGVTLMTQEERFKVMELLQAQNPNPKSELEYSNNFELICAVVLSAQATDVSVNKATPALFAVAKDAKSMAALGEEGIAPYIKSIGLWKSKAKNLAALAKTLDEQYHGEIPSTYDELILLPGVGSKTAKVVLNVAFKQPYIAVDTHIFRVCNRTGLCLGKTPQAVEKNLPALVDHKFIMDAHHYILLHGRYNCTAQRFTKNCATCIIRDYCKRNFPQES